MDVIYDHLATWRHFEELAPVIQSLWASLAIVKN